MRATDTPENFDELKKALYEVVDAVTEKGSKKSADDRARIMFHWYTFVTLMEPDIGQGGAEWDENIVFRYAKLFLPYLVSLTFFYYIHLNNCYRSRLPQDETVDRMSSPTL